MPALRAGLSLLGLVMLSLGSLSSGLSGQDDARKAGRRIVATASLAAKEYAEGVVNGRVVLQEEVEEARLFITEARSTAQDLPSDLVSVTAVTLDSMLRAVETVQDPAIVTRLANHLAMALNDALGGLDERLPARRADLGAGAAIYVGACATCHGDLGKGDGPGGAALDPPPSDLTDGDALVDQSPLDFYRKVLIGVSGTAMPGFESTLSRDEIWAVARYAATLRHSAGAIERGEAIFWSHCRACEGVEGDGFPALARLPGWLADPADLATQTDEELVVRLRGGSLGSDVDSADAVAVVAFLRSHPFADDAAAGAEAVLSDVRTEIARGLRAYRERDLATASTKIFDSYVAFEAVEKEIALRDNGLVTDLEFAFSQLRGAVDRGDDDEAVIGAYANIHEKLLDAEATLGAETSTASVFAQSFILLLREGVEALLIIGALAMLVTRAGAPDRKRDIRLGVVVAIVASLITAVLFESVFRIGVAQQEILEGATMLLAAGVLLFVSYWLISKIEVKRWRDFVAAHGQRAVRSGSAFALGLAAFLAVYREGFETVLFYKALFITTEGAGTGAIVAGALAAVAVLVALYIGMTRFGVRIPIRPFFAVTSAVLMYMAFSFAGKGIAELQESNLIGTTLLDWAPRIPWMGIYPTLQTLVLQLAILSLILFGLAWTFFVQPRFAQSSA